MRVGIDVTPLLRQRTGIGVCTELIVDILEADGHDVVGLASGWRALRAGIPALSFPVRRHWVPWLANALCVDMLQRPAVEDVVGDVDAYVATNHVILPARRARSIVLLHDVGPLTHPHLYSRRQVRRFRVMARRLARFGDAFVVPTRAVASDAVALGLVEPERLTVVPWFARPLPAEGALPPGVPPDPPLILCVATLERRKNVPSLIRAFQGAAWRVPHHLVVAGGVGSARNEAAVARSNGAVGRIHFIGHASPAQLGALYRRADLAVCPSLYEGFGLPLVEAMGHGCPVLATDIPAHREVGGDAVRLVPPEDEGAMMEGLVDLVRDGGARAALRRLGSQRSRRFSEQRTRRLLADAFTRRCAPSGRGAGG